MSEIRSAVRLRQAVLVAGELEPSVAAVRAELGLGEPFRDPGVAEFGLTNAVFTVGDCFIEVISPAEPGTAAGRYLDRRGEGGYMVIFDLEDLDGARSRAQRLGIRVVWQIDLPDISGTHLHPADVGGAIVSLDSSRPYGAWRWGGPDWTGRIGVPAPGRLAGITVAASDPASTAARWADVLGVGVCRDEQPTLELDGPSVGFISSGGSPGAAFGEIVVQVPAETRRGRDAVEIGGARFRLSDAD